MTSTSSLVRRFGQTADGHDAALYTLQNDFLRVQITDFGGRMVSIETPDRKGQRQHILLGFDGVAEYESAGGYFGALLGRNANRIAGGRLTLEGRTYQVSKNEGEATLHGGKVGFDKVFWHVTAFDAAQLVLGHVSPDGDQGFPGTLSVRATYRLEGQSIVLLLEAETTDATPVNLSAHPYFNLGGLSAGDVLDHEILIEADSFLPTNAKQIPTGEIRPVNGTPFDFRQAASVGARICQADSQLLYGKGYDHCFVLDISNDHGTPRLAARARHRQSGRVLEIFTAQPGIQFYTGNNLNGSVAGRGGAYRQSAGFAFEPQGFPNSPNQPNFPTTTLRPNSHYREVMRYQFTTD